INVKIIKITGDICRYIMSLFITVMLFTEIPETIRIIPQKPKFTRRKTASCFTKLFLPLYPKVIKTAEIQQKSFIIKLIGKAKGSKKISKENKEVMAEPKISLKFFILRLRNFLTQSSIK